MRTLLLLAVGVLLAHAKLMVHFQNRCNSYYQPESGATLSQDSIPHGWSFCHYELSVNWHQYRLGKEGKTLINVEVVANKPEITFWIDSTAGFEDPIKVVPVLNGVINGTVIECEQKGCDQAIWNTNEDYKKYMYTTHADTIYVSFCADRPKANMKCANHPPSGDED